MWKLISEEKPTEGQSCWISNGTEVLWAKYSTDDTHTWTNNDTWEDFNGEYLFWQPAEMPALPVLERTSAITKAG